jgi:hypothetical protein
MKTGPSVILCKYISTHKTHSLPKKLYFSKLRDHCDKLSVSGTATASSWPFSSSSSSMPFHKARTSNILNTKTAKKFAGLNVIRTWTSIASGFSLLNTITWVPPFFETNSCLLVYMNSTNDYLFLHYTQQNHSTSWEEKALEFDILSWIFGWAFCCIACKLESLGSSPSKFSP